MSPVLDERAEQALSYLMVEIVLGLLPFLAAFVAATW